MAELLASTPEETLDLIHSRERRYELGQFFTPEPIASFLAEAVGEIDPETVLDPGVGGGALLRAVGPGPKRFGCDVDPEAVRLANDALASQGGDLEIVRGDFLAPAMWPFTATEFDAVIANPPYIRHHNLTQEHKALAERYSNAFSTTVSRLSGSYVYFFLEALLRLRDGGRLAFITPTEFLDARYGAAVKEALLGQCRIEDVIVLEMDELAFDGVLTTSAITIATKTAKPNGRLRLTEASLDSTVELGRHIEIGSDETSAGLPWTPLLPSRAERIAKLTRDRPAQLGEYARIRRGIGSGDNSFFCLTQAQVDEWGIEAEYLVPVVLGAKDLPENGSPVTRSFWRQRKAAGARSWLLWCHVPRAELAGTRVLRYIDHGESLGLPERFNCRTRNPWYGVERVPVPDFFVTYMSRQRARFVRNESGARCMTSLLNLWVKEGVDRLALRAVLEDEANAEILRAFGRTYGGGLGKIEPNDLRRLPVPRLGAGGLPEAA
ncbi:MAG: N-6 DNA methylase [Solirubrobacterales bacterium]